MSNSRNVHESEQVVGESHNNISHMSPQARNPSPLSSESTVSAGSFGSEAPDSSSAPPSHQQIQMTPLSGNEDSRHNRGDPEIGSDCSSEASDSQVLIYSNREPLKLKQFNQEVRALMDVEQFAHQSELMLFDTSTSATSTQDIVEMMTQKICENEADPDKPWCEKRLRLAEEIFVPGSTVLMAKTIQGAQASPVKEGLLESDQTWLCALCTSAQVKRRHMVVSRFKQPIDMGANAHRVKLFVLIVTPTREKGTKAALETGRTFATLLADSKFRQKLLECATMVEFKANMIVRAKQLSGSRHFNNRHKYMLDAVLGSSISELTAGQTNFNKSQVSPTMSKLTSPRKNSQSCGILNGNQPIVKFNKNPDASRLMELMESANQAGMQDTNVAISYSNGTGPQKVAVKQENTIPPGGYCEFGKGLWDDFTRRLRYYPSDFRDAFVGPPRTVQKTVATIWFLYFGILLPTIAFSSLNTHQTHGHMGDLRKAIIGQAVGGLAFAILGGQPLVIIMTTAPLCLYTKVIHQMCIDYDFHFPAMYAAVGLWNGVFLVIYSLFGFSKLMRWCTRSTEEVFALFIVIAFITDAGKDLIKNFQKYYYTEACAEIPTQSRLFNETIAQFDADMVVPVCRRETSLLFVLLMLGTLWLSVTLYRFKQTPFLSLGKRELLAEYALPLAVITMSFVGSYVFNEIHVEKFPPVQEIHFERAKVELMPLSGMLVSMGLGFTLSLLFFMDQNISAAMVNSPEHNLKKGDAFHYDLLVVGVLNGFLTAFGLPMMHGVLPHSPLHARSLSDITERLEEGHLRQVVSNCRENRVTAIVSHLLLLASLLLIPYPIAYIPRAVLNGLFLYMAVTSLDGLEVFERILLLFTEQSNYPPNHYIRRCPQKSVHKFTGIQLIQLLVMCLFGFSPVNIVEMFFPVMILLMIPFRYKVVPKYLDKKYLEALDGKH